MIKPFSCESTPGSTRLGQWAILSGGALRPHQGDWGDRGAWGTSQIGCWKVGFSGWNLLLFGFHIELLLGLLYVGYLLEDFGGERHHLIQKGASMPPGSWHSKSPKSNQNFPACHLHCMVTDHRWRLAIWTTAEELGTDVVAYNSAIASCRAQWQVAWHLLAIQLSQGVKLEPNVRSYGAVASACTGEVGHWAKAKFLLEDMAGRQVTPNLVSFNTIAGACRSAGRWLQVLELVGSSGQQPDVISLTLAVGAAEQAASWGAALQVLDQAVGLQPDMMFYSTTMSACQGAGQWKGVLHLLASDRVRECLLSTVAYNVAISSSEGSWQLPLELLEFMKFSLAKPDLYSFNSSIRACGKGSWRAANEMLRAAGRAGLTPDVVTYSSLAHVDAWHFSILALSTAQE